MYTTINIAINVLYVLVVLNLIFLVVVYGMKIKQVKHKKRSDQFDRKFKDYLIYIQAHLNREEGLSVPPTRMNQVESALLQERIIDMIESFSGVQRQKLIALCEELGFVEYHLKRLNSRSYRKKIDAAYYLGCMRVKEAVPSLLKFLREHEHDSSLFVIARAVAKCARDEQDVKAMVRILLKHKKEFHDLLVDIIQEADIDQAALFGEFINEEHPTFIKIGLTGLHEFTHPGVVAAAYRLLDHEDEEIQLKAVNVYLNSSYLLPKHVANKLLRHVNPDIRLLTIEALSKVRDKSHLSAMKESLKDEEKRVVYACAKGLINLGQEGIAVLGEAASEARGTEQAEVFERIFEEEMKLLSLHDNDLGKLTRYSELMYTYEKTFGKNNRIYRVV